MSPVFAVAFVVRSFSHHLSNSFDFDTSSTFPPVCFLPYNRRSWPLTSLSVCLIGRLRSLFVFDIILSVIKRPYSHSGVHANNLCLFALQSVNKASLISVISIMLLTLVFFCVPRIIWMQHFCIIIVWYFRKNLHYIWKMKLKINTTTD